MQLVVKDGVVVAYHPDGQAIDGLYPGCGIVSWDQALPAEIIGMPVPQESDVPLTVDVVRRRKLSALSAWKILALARGYDTGLGFSIGIADTDQHTFASYKVWLDTLVQGGQRTLDSLVVVSDIHGDPYSITVAQFNAVMLAYGASCESLFQQGAVTSSHLMRATTIDEVDAVQLPQ
jgi:hypothetical protein